MADFECPYCYKQLSSPEYYGTEQETYIPYQCDNCDKHFVYCWVASVNFETFCAPCLNGAEHSWRKIIGIPKEHFANRLRCEDCGKEKVTPFTAEVL
jgi:transcription elongation factor Elf1